MRHRQAVQPRGQLAPPPGVSQPREHPQREQEVHLGPRWQVTQPALLLRVYVKCIAGQQGEAKRRIEDAMRPLEGDELGSSGEPAGPEHPDDEHAGP
jgi:hypothetical protein